MTNLASQTCEPCSGNATPMNSEDAHAALEALPQWKITDHDGIMKLTRSYDFDDFAGALAFTQRVGDIAEEAGHHPMITTEYGKATVTWWSHEIGGLHQNDFILAARTDEVAE